MIAGSWAPIPIPQPRDRFPPRQPFCWGGQLNLAHQPLVIVVCFCEARSARATSAYMTEFPFGKILSRWVAAARTQFVGACQGADPVFCIRPSVATRRGLASVSSPQVLKPPGRQLGITDRRLDRAMPEITLQRSSIGAFVRQHEPTGVPQHVRMHGERHFCRGLDGD